MDWSKGLTARYRGFIVDPTTWKDVEEIEIQSGSISKSEDSLRESADIQVPNYNSEKEEWIRIYLDARQESDSFYGPIFTGLISAPTKNYEGVVQRSTLKCYSVLKPASDILLPKGYYVSYGANTYNELLNLLSVIDGTPINLIEFDDEPIPDIPQTIIAEAGETKLSMADRILYSIGWVMRIGGDGSINISKLEDEPSLYFDADEFDSLEIKVDISNNWFDCPNVFRAIQGEYSAIAIDDNPDSPLSIPNRGREIWMEETNATPFIGESLSEYAERRLSEEQQISISASYSRRFHPDANVSDVILLKYPDQGLNGIFYIASQTITIGYSPTVSEVVYKL